MVIETDHFEDGLDFSFKIFHELMTRKVREILLVSSLYDFCIMEEDGRLSERIIHEYRGLNLSQPPRITWVPSAEEALAALDTKDFDMVITMPRLADMDTFVLGRKIKSKMPDLPVILMTHSALTPDFIPQKIRSQGIDRVFVWSGNTDILLALIKNAEDRLNVIRDTELAGVRVILFVEDSPIYASVLLPILYRAIVLQAQAVMVEGLNEEHRLLTMRARPKILYAISLIEARRLFEQFEPYILGVISDVSFPNNDEIDHNAGIKLLSEIKKERFDIPLLLTSSEPSNREKAVKIPASFIDKNSPSLLSEVRSFFVDKLGFGDFVFRMPDGREIGRAANFRALEKILPTIPQESLYHHWRHNDFSRWLFARSEIRLASKWRPLRDTDFGGQVEMMRQYLIDTVRARRKLRQQGVVVNFDADDFDPDTDFLKIGKGSLGGKGRGLAFISTLLRRNSEIHQKFDQVNLVVPKTLVITTEGFNTFIAENDLTVLSKSDLADKEIMDRFQKAHFPVDITEDLRAYLAQVHYPLAIRSSGLLEDAQFRAYACLYSTYLIPNDHPDLEVRLAHLIAAIKGVYASTYFRDAKGFARHVGHRTEDEKMAVIVQQLIGQAYGNYFYPAISGIAQSHNYYPFSHMQPEDGIVNIALGLGKMVSEGEKTLRFCPKYPQLLPQRTTVDDILENAQHFFYVMKIADFSSQIDVDEDATLEKREVSDAAQETPIKLLASTYFPGEHKIRDTAQMTGYPVLTFAPVLKYQTFPLADILVAVLEASHQGMGCPVEIEFSVNLSSAKGGKPEFALLQIRPMSARTEHLKVDIRDEEIARAFCYSGNALGNAVKTDIADIIFVRPDSFDPGRTVEIAREIGKINSQLVSTDRKYLLIGPGRWGSADRWLGIPVNWSEICGVGAIIETTFLNFRADPSQGSHFFHNIITLGINYISISDNGKDFLSWEWLTSQPAAQETSYLAHIKLDKPFTLKVDGRNSRCVMFTD
ncbi:MAG: PEP/pyruvate-binding domain-containing protein [Desulfobacteraceae bacterium]|jgi:CheY-like chemotaxis protein|nr:PEP/pyruvate-binding domain-containing protein [Desulfobacteraceae bacterium]